MHAQLLETLNLLMSIMSKEVGQKYVEGLSNIPHVINKNAEGKENM